MNRALRAATVGALLGTALTLAGCSAGQVAQTAGRAPGGIGTSGDLDALALRNLRLPHPTGGVYAEGGDARLIGAIANASSEDDTLVGIESEDFEAVEAIDPQAVDPEAPTGGADLEIVVPAGQTVFLGEGDGPTVTLTGLGLELAVGQAIDVTFTFERAGAITLPVPLAVPARDLERGEVFDFHEEESAEEG